MSCNLSLRQIDEAFQVAVAGEDNAFRQLDELMTQYAPKEFQDLYRAGRQEVSGVRQLMRENVVRFMDDPLGDGRAYIDLDVKYEDLNSDEPPHDTHICECECHF